MILLYENETSYTIDDNLITSIKLCIDKSLKFENFTNNIEVSLTIVDNNTIKHLNHKYRLINKETDVLSFPLIDDFLTDNKLFTNKVPLLLGDIVISIEKASTQALDYNHSIKRELCFLVVHSMLHLLGYDHLNDYDEKIMLKKQDDILNALDIVR